MTFVEESVISGFIGKIISDCVDVSWGKIEEGVKNKHQNIQSQIYNVVVNVLNQMTYNKYADSQDKVYQAAEKLLTGYKEDRCDSIEVVRSGLHILGESVNRDKYMELKRMLYQELCKDDYEELYRQIRLLQQDKERNRTSRIEKKIDKVQQSVDETNWRLDAFQKKNGKVDNIQNRKPVKSRTQEYADKWNENMFLNDFDKRDEDAGENITLSEVYLETHLPHYIWRNNKNVSYDMKELLSEYIYGNNENKMLLVLGQPGIGKSTLITWIIANFFLKIDDIFVYKFASDLKNVDWKGEKLSKEILGILNLSYKDLNGKILILDGFDELSIGGDRKEILDRLYHDLIYKKKIHKFVLILTCRENYVRALEGLKCDYVILQPWDERQIQSFCDIYYINTRNKITENSMNNILKNRAILGIPLILYMTLALNISIEEEGAIVDIYDQIFSLRDGGIYDRCIHNSNYADSHWISKMKMQIHQVSRHIAIWMFEKNPDEASIPQRAYQEICMNIVQENYQDNSEIERSSLIGNFFRLKHCEGIQGEQLYFIHRTIYEYFVAEAIYTSIENALVNLSEESQEELAGNISVLLMNGKIDYTIGEFLKNKIYKIYKVLPREKQEVFGIWWKKAFNKMITSGMFYFTKRNMQNFENIISKECQCFVNLLEIIRRLKDLDNVTYLWSYVDQKYLEKYIRHSALEVYESGKRNFIDLSYVNLCGINLQRTNLCYANLTETYFRQANLGNSDLQNANLQGADFRGADLRRVDLRQAKLKGTIFYGANLRGANLRDINLEEANLLGAILDENQVKYLREKYSLKGTRIYVFKTREIVDYEKYSDNIIINIED
jgi:uncharacterized protein YjbI with pentapeptide repeats